MILPRKFRVSHSIASWLTAMVSAGLTSHASVNLMLALEDEFDIEFPERLLRRQTFESVAAIAEAIDELNAELNV